jgi:hypothetical protein
MLASFSDKGADSMDFSACGLGIEAKAKHPAARATGICTQNTARHPRAGSNAPAMMAPQATPDVYAVLMHPKKRPRLLLLEYSCTKMKETGVMAAPPAPVIARPRRKTPKVGAREVISNPHD